MAVLLRESDEMADVLGFFTRREIARQLASVSGAFSALCNCWCRQPETVTGTGSGITTAFENGQQRKRKWNQGSKGWK